MTLQDLYLKYSWAMPLFLLWSILWKGTAMWQAAQKRQLSWFLILLVVNTLGILEIIYLVYLHRFSLGSPLLLKYFSRFNKKSK